jgi:hypothetical protein
LVSGEYLPLSVWTLRGFDAELIKQSGNCVEHPVLGPTYCVALETNVYKVQTERSAILEKWSKKVKEKKGTAAVKEFEEDADEDGGSNEEDSSSSKSDTSSSSSRSSHKKKKKKGKKNKKDKKDKDRKTAKKPQKSKAKNEEETKAKRGGKAKPKETTTLAHKKRATLATKILQKVNPALAALLAHNAHEFIQDLPNFVLETAREHERSLNTIKEQVEAQGLRILC